MGTASLWSSKQGQPLKDLKLVTSKPKCIMGRVDVCLGGV